MTADNYILTVRALNGIENGIWFVGFVILCVGGLIASRRR